MHKFLLFLAYLLWSNTAQGQSFFEILPDVGGINGQAMSFIVVPDSNSIKAVSYTHLDVYKRQDLGQPKPNFVFLLIVKVLNCPWL